MSEEHEEIIETLDSENSSEETEETTNEEIIETFEEDTLGFEDRDFTEEMRSSYLDYAMSVIVGRALPDVRDGLKPVHRRILFSMNEANIKPSSPYLKSALTVGQVLGNYHPHGDSSVYDAMVRLAQPWRMNLPLIDFQGNMGSLDGDNAAAMRYTEARLGKAALGLLDNLDEETVDYQPNYDGRLLEPSVLPAKYPNILVNGSEGIAVGMATSIPSHNLRETCKALCAYIDNNNITIPELIQIMPAPDFSTKGELVASSSIRSAYETGRGKAVIRGKCDVETRKNGRERIIITEIPFGIQKGDSQNKNKGLIKKIDELIKNKKIPEISEVRDESSNKEGLRIVVNLRPNSITKVVINKLYKHTALQTSISYNMVVLHKGQPRLMGLKEIFAAYIEHRVEVITRRSLKELASTRKQKHILEGLLIALADIDKIIAIIRGAANNEDARTKLIEKYSLDQIQADAILDMRLRQLSTTDAVEVQKENDKLAQRIEELRELLGSETAILEVIKKEVTEYAEEFGVDRQTPIVADETSSDMEDLIAEEPIVVMLTKAGYMKRVSIDEFKNQNRGGRGARGVSLTDDNDYLMHASVMTTHEWLLAFTNKGRVWRMKGWQIPEGAKTGGGRSLANVIALEENEKIVAFCTTKTFDNTKSIIFATKHGTIKRTLLSLYDTNLRANALKAMTLNAGDELINVEIADENQSAMILTKTGKGQHIKVADIRSSGRTSGGVKAIKIIDDDQVVSMSIHNPENKNNYLLLITTKGKGKRVPIEDFRTRGRGGIGVKAITLEEDDLFGGVSINENEEILIITEKGMTVRLEADNISAYSRSSKGLKIMRVLDDDNIASLCVINNFEPDKQ